MSTSTAQKMNDNFPPCITNTKTGHQSNLSRKGRKEFTMTDSKKQKITAEYSDTRHSLTYILNRVVFLARQEMMSDLEEYLMELPADKVYWVETVMYLGRDDFRVEDIDENYEYLCSCGPPEDTICNMLGKEPTQLKNYLEAGIKALKKHKVDIDTLPNITK